MESSADNVPLESDFERLAVTDRGSPSLQQELLDLLARNSRRVPIPVFLATGLIAAVVYDNTRSVWPLLWLACVAAFLVVRYFYLSRLPNRRHVSEAARLRAAVVLSGANGVLHAGCLVFFPLLGEFDRLLVTIMVLALCAGAVGSTVGYRPVLLAYVVPMLAPLSAFWAINPGEETGWRELFVAALILLFIVLLMTLARDAFKLFRESFNIRLEHVELNRRLEKALEESRIANEAKTRFLAAASHDLRQPVHALALFSAALSRRGLDEKTRNVAEHIQSAVDALSLQLDALLDISRLDAGVVKIKLESFDLRAVLDRLHEQFNPLAADKGLALIIRCPEDAAVYTDQMLLEQIIRNLLANAVKYTDRGTVSVVARKEDEKYLLQIADTGRGIPEEAQSHVFEEFFQVNNPGRDRSQGLGLGLAIIKRLVDLLAIPLEMNSTVGKGSVFSLSVPSAESVDESRSLSNVDFSFDRVTVLCIDDEREVREGMRALLEELGCRVFAADDLAQALDTVKQTHLNVVLCDFRLADGCSGIDAIERIQAIRPALPAVLITGDTGADRLHEVRSAGLVVLHKPIRLEALKAAVEQACTQNEV